MTSEREQIARVIDANAKPWEEDCSYAAVVKWDASLAKADQIIAMRGEGEGQAGVLKDAAERDSLRAQLANETAEVERLERINQKLADQVDDRLAKQLAATRRAEQAEAQRDALMEVVTDIVGISGEAAKHHSNVEALRKTIMAMASTAHVALHRARSALDAVQPSPRKEP